MRRFALAVTAALGIVLFSAAAASAAPSPAPVPSATPGQPVCTVDNALAGITGLAATANGYAVATKATAGITMKVYVLDADCKRTKSLSYSGAGPHDPQDIQVGTDGNFWIADTGDDITNPVRTKIALWKMTPEGKATLYRFTYPDGAHAGEAMLLNGNGAPIFVTTTTNGVGGLYTPAGALDATGNAVALKHVGDFTPQKTGTSNSRAVLGQTRITGAADAPDGKRVAIRTYSDAYEWDVKNGDVVAAITTATPRITPMPDEPQGEAIAYSHDGGVFLTVSDLTTKQQGVPTQVMKYKPSVPAPPVKAGAGATGAVKPKGDTRDFFTKLGLQDILRIIGGVGVLGLLMVVGGIVGIRRARKRQPPPSSRKRGGSPSPPYDNDPMTANEPTSAMAAVPAGRRDRLYDAEPYAADPYAAADPYQAAPYESRRPYPPADRGYGYAEETDRYAAPPRPSTGPPNPAPRADRGIARSHRPGTRRGPRDASDGGRNRGGYSERHDGFGDMLE